MKTQRNPLSTVLCGLEWTFYIIIWAILTFCAVIPAGWFVAVFVFIALYGVMCRWCGALEEIE